MKNVFNLAATMVERSNSIESPSVLVQLKMWFEKIFGDLSYLNIYLPENDLYNVCSGRFLSNFPLVSLLIFPQTAWFFEIEGRGKLTSRPLVFWHCSGFSVNSSVSGKTGKIRSGRTLCVGGRCVRTHVCQREQAKAVGKSQKS